MVRSVLFALFLVSVTAAGIAAQATDPSLEKAQKAVKKALINNTPGVYDVSVDACRLSFKVSGGGGLLTDSTGSPSNAGGLFPHDDSSNYLSAGPGRSGAGTPASEKFVVDASQLAADRIIIAPRAWRGHVYVTLNAVKTKNAIATKRDGKMVDVRSMSFSVKTKAAEKTAKTIRDLIDKCTGQ